GAAIVSIEAAKVKSAPFNGNAKSTLVSQTTLAGGGAQATSSLSGKASKIGKFTGSLDTTFAPGLTSYTAHFTIIAANGDEIFASAQGTFKTTKKGPTSTAHFTITGGTGSFAGATGGGSVTTVLDTATGGAKI